MIIIAGVIVFNFYIFVGYIIQSISIYQYHQKITNKDQYISKLEREQKEVKPTLKRSYQVAEELNKLKAERARLIIAWKAVQQKGNRGSVSRGTINRTSPYQLKQIPEESSRVTSLTELNGNLEQLEEFINQESKEQQKLLNQLLAYEKMLDHTPTAWPVGSRKITSWFGYRVHPKYGDYRRHTGIDIKVSTGTKVCAAADGRVSFAGYRNGYGYTIVINHGYGYETLYAHNSKLVAKPGTQVKRGQLISYSGNSGTSTGPHLHFEVHNNGVIVNPAQYLRN